MYWYVIGWGKNTEGVSFAISGTTGVKGKNLNKSEGD